MKYAGMLFWLAIIAYNVPDLFRLFAGWEPSEALVRGDHLQGTMPKHSSNFYW